MCSMSRDKWAIYSSQGKPRRLRGAGDTWPGISPSSGRTKGQEQLLRHRKQTYLSLFPLEDEASWEKKIWESPWRFPIWLMQNHGLFSQKENLCVSRTLTWGILHHSKTCCCRGKTGGTRVALEGAFPLNHCSTHPRRTPVRSRVGFPSPSQHKAMFKLELHSRKKTTLCVCC